MDKAKSLLDLLPEDVVNDLAWLRGFRHYRVGSLNDNPFDADLTDQHENWNRGWNDSKQMHESTGEYIG